MASRRAGNRNIGKNCNSPYANIVRSLRSLRHIPHGDAVGIFCLMRVTNSSRNPPNCPSTHLAVDRASSEPAPENAWCLESETFKSYAGCIATAICGNRICRCSSSQSRQSALWNVLAICFMKLDTSIDQCFSINGLTHARARCSTKSATRVSNTSDQSDCCHTVPSCFREDRAGHTIRSFSTL